MTRYVLIPGADGRAWYWHLVVPELRARGHDVVTVDLPQDESAGLAEYTDAVVRAIGAPTGGELVLVAQSLAGFIAPLVCERIPVDGLILVSPMVPAPGESAGTGGRTPVRPRPVRPSRCRRAGTRTRPSTC